STGDDAWEVAIGLLEGVRAVVASSFAEVCRRESRAERASSRDGGAIIAFDRRPGKTSVVLESSIHVPAAQGFPHQVMAVLQKRDVIERRKQHIVGHIEVGRPIVIVLVERIEGIPVASSSLPGASVHAAAILIFAKELEPVRKTPGSTHVQRVEMAVHISGGKIDRGQNRIQLGINQVKANDSKHLTTLAALVSKRQNRTCRQLTMP